MKFTPTWYKNPSFTGIPSFQEMEDITGMAYDDKGNYIGPKEKPKMQLVLDQTTNRQFWAPEEYDDDAVKYGAALLNKDFNSSEWWGMVYDPHLTKTQKVSLAFIEGLKQGAKSLLKAPTEIVAGVSGISDAMGINIPVTKTGPNVATVAEKIGKGASLSEITEESVNTIFSTVNPIAYFGSNLVRKGIKASANDFVDMIKSMKSPRGEMGDTARLYRASAQNWEATLDKYLPDVDDNIKAHSTLVTIGSMAGQIGGSLLLAAATSGVGGLPAVAGVFGSQQFYSMREEYLQKGYSLQSANIYAGLAAVAEGGLEAVGFSHWLKYATLKPSLRNHLIAGFMEANQEASQTTAEELIANLSGVREETLTEILANISIAALAGFIPGAGISVVGGGLGIRQEKAEYEINKALEAPKTVKMLERGEIIKGPGVKAELELAKANKGSNQLYDTVRNIAVSYGVNNERAIDGFYYYARNKRVQGITSEALLEGLGKQIVAYNKQLLMNNKMADAAGKKAADDISYHLSEEAVNKFRENTKSAAEKSGLSREEAARVAMSESKIYEHLSKEFGEDVANVKQVEIVVPEAVEGKKMTLDEALAEAQAIDGQIAELSKLEGTEQQVSKLEEEKVNLLNRGYINLGDTINKITLTKLSDVTTIKHEFMHHWDDIIDLMAAKGNKKAKSLKEAKDRIVAKNKAYVKQDKNKAREVITEAYEAWLYSGVVAENAAEQKLFDAIKGYFQSVYESVRDITGIRIDSEVNLFFKQMTGLAPIKVNENLEENNNRLFQFAGPNAQTADPLALNRAEQLLADGQDPEAVRRATGWFKGADGKWRFEISDKSAQILSPERSPALEYHLLRAQDGLTQEQKTRLAELDKELNRVYLTLDEILQHEKLYAAYPALRQVEVFPLLADEMGGADALVTKDGQIHLDRSFLNEPKKLKTVLMHEVQHWIQQEEGFARGGSPAEFVERREELEEEREALLQEQEETGADNSDRLQEIEMELDEDGTAGYDEYRRLAGEVEARNTEARLNFTEEQRRATAPESTQDVENADAVIVFDDGSEFEYARKGTLNRTSPDMFTADTTLAENFKQSVQTALKDDAVSNRYQIEMGFVPYIYQQLGLPKQELKTNKLALRKALGLLTQEELQAHPDWHNHNVPREIIDNLPALIANPAAVFRSNTKEGVYVAVLDAKAGDNPVVAILSPSGKKSNYTFIPTVYERNNFADFVAKTLQKDNVLYVNNTDAKKVSLSELLTQASIVDNGTSKSSKFGRPVGLQLPVGSTENRDYTNSILTKEDFVNRELFQPAYHGTPHRFDNFSTEHIGTGEGAQAHGWGLYFAQNKEVSERYRTKLQHRIKKHYTFLQDGKELPTDVQSVINNEVGGHNVYLAAKGDLEELRASIKRVARSLIDRNDPIIKIANELTRAKEDIIRNPKMSISRFLADNTDYRFESIVKSARLIAKNSGHKATISDVLSVLNEHLEAFNKAVSVQRENANKLLSVDLDKLTVREEQGQLFEVNIPENDVLLDEDKTFNEQPEKVKEALKRIAEDNGSKLLRESISENETGGSIYRAIVLDNKAFLQNYNEDVSYSETAKNASELLLVEGVQGITYNGGRDGRAYVIFDDKAIRIQQTFYQTVKAQQTGARAADSKPSKEQIEKDINILRTNGVEKYERKSRIGQGIIEWGKDIILSIRQRAGVIDPKIKAFFDKLDYFQPNLEKKFASRANGFIKKYQQLTEAEKNELDYYIYNQLHDEMDAFLKQKNMTKEYQDVRQLLNFIYAISNQAGIDMGFIEEYFPTSMIDYAGFLDYMKGTDKWSTIEQALKEGDPKGVWSDKEKADAINNFLRGYSLDPVKKPKNANERKILYKSPELMRFYEHSDVALIKYLQGMGQAIAINKAFGKGGGFDTDATIGGIVLELINSGTITHKEEAEIKKLLKSRLSYRATPEFISMVKNVGYLQTMNNFTSAITQLGDLYAPFYKYGFGTAIKSIFGKSELTVQDLGLDKIWEEFSDSSKSGILVDKLFKAVGLEKMDKFGKKVAIDASLINLREQANNGSVDLLNRLVYTFGKDSTRVLGDIKNGKLTDDVKILVWADLADTQPIGRSGVPAGYLDHPHGRLFYQLKTFTLNQLSLFYADSLVNIQKGIKYKNKKQFLKGVQNGFKLLLLLTAGNATADVLKNIIMGREIDVSDTVVSNLLWNIGVSKYTFYKGKRDGYVRAILSSYLMPPQVSAFDDTWIDARKIASGKRELKDTTAVTYLPFGRAYYWWFGGGRTSEEKKKEKKK